MKELIPFFLAIALPALGVASDLAGPGSPAAPVTVALRDVRVALM